MIPCQELWGSNPQSGFLTNRENGMSATWICWLLVVAWVCTCHSGKQSRDSRFQTLFVYGSNRISFWDLWENIFIRFERCLNLVLILVKVKKICSGDMSQHYSEHEEAPEGEDGDTSVAASFYLRYNPDVTVEIRFEFLPEIQLSYEQPLQFLLGSTVDVLKKTISNHVYYTHRFTFLKRHFQMML